MKPLAALLFAIFALLATPTVADARWDYEGQTPAPAVANTLVDQANTWIETNASLLPPVRPCPNGIERWYIADETIRGAENAWARGWHEADDSQCALWLSENLVMYLWHAEDLDSLVKACGSVYHEVGHARGLAHEDAPFMHGIVPAECWAYAQAIIKRIASAAKKTVNRVAARETTSKRKASRASRKRRG